MIELRPYQRSSVDAILKYWSDGGGNPLVDLATGTGKSVVIATLERELVEQYPNLRVLMLVHVRELVEQNAKALLRVWPSAPIGINSAGLGRRDKRSQILCASIQSVANESADTLGERHLVIVDEAHLIPKSGNGMYRKLLGKLREAVPDLRVVGFTATPYRLDSGRLDGGNDALFDEVVFTYGIGQGVDEGFLSPLVSRSTGQVIDVRNVERRGGEFVAGALEAAANQDAITQAACAEIITKGADRKSWLTFCAGVKHALAVRDAMRDRGIHAECVTGDTPKGERDRIIQDFRSGRIRCLTNANVLTTGFDAPCLDLIAMLRPTLSTSLYVQMLGRGTRLADGKENCLVLDFAENVRRHGPVDAVEVRGNKGGAGEGKVAIDSIRAKECPTCETLVSLRTFTCTYCGHEWPRPAEPKHSARADQDVAVMSRDLATKWLPVSNVAAYPHHKEGSPTSMRIEYLCGYTVYKEWVTFEHPGFAGAKAARWWRSIAGTEHPKTVAEAIKRIDELKVFALTPVKDGKFWRMSRYRAHRPDGRVVEIDDKMNVRSSAIQPLREAS